VRVACGRRCDEASAVDGCTEHTHSRVWPLISRCGSRPPVTGAPTAESDSTPSSTHCPLASWYRAVIVGKS
jgi:hypothetical protein